VAVVAANGFALFLFCFSPLFALISRRIPSAAAVFALHEIEVCARVLDFVENAGVLLMTKNGMSPPAFGEWGEVEGE
jgi:hypothetical protein